MMGGFVRKWLLWQQRRSLSYYLLAVDLVVALAWVGTFVTIPIRNRDWIILGVLIACVVIYTEVSRPIEKWRDRASNPHVNLSSVWMFAGVLLLHPGLAAVLTATCFGYPWIRVYRRTIHRQVFNVAVMTFSSFSARMFLDWVEPVPFDEMSRDVRTFSLIVAAAAVFLIVNTALVAVAVFNAARGVRLRDAMAVPSDVAIESATIGLGILLAWAIADWPVALCLVVGVTLVLHRSVLIRQLREKARADGKTGLLNAEAWIQSAGAELARRADASLLMIDIDHFKRINDQHGHIAGDEVLCAVADTLKAEVRANDLVGRYGGDEFVVFLPGTDGADAMAIAERIRHSVTRPSVVDSSVSIGIAVHDGSGTSLDDLLRVADLALYEAKDAGRNRSAMSTA
jgi:diguanylate cyclase (GGDEF)-like protein